MKILHIITGLGLGGAEATLNRLIINSDKMDSTAVISLREDGIYADHLRDLGVTVHSLGMRKGRVTVKGLFMLYRHIKEYRPDVIQTWMYHADLIGGIAGRIAQTKPICWGIRHSDLDPIETKKSTRLVAKLCAITSGWIPSKIISCSQVAIDFHIRYGYAANKFTVIPNGYDLNVVAPDIDTGNAIRSELSISNETPIIGMVARLNPQKDHANLIQAISILKQRNISLTCLLVGEGISNDNSTIYNSIKDAGIEDSVKLLGPRRDVISIMNALDLHVLSSSFGEGFPNVVAEAMACGTPCVATDVGDAGLIIKDTGWIVPSKNSDALANAIASAIKEKTMNANIWKKRKKMCRERIVNHYSVENMVKTYQKVWTQETENSKN
jgi:glycosyltransferase involved in cell wall biosynthesis